MTKRIGVAEAKAKFSELLEGVAHGEEHYIIERHGRAVAALVTPAELERIESEQQLAPHPRGALALVGLWAEFGDEAVDEFIELIARSRESDTDRPVDLEA